MDDSRKRKFNDTADSHDGDQTGKRKIIGPALPSEHDQKTSHDDDSDDSDDDIGPILPPSGTEHLRLDNKPDDAGLLPKENQIHTNSRQRDEWMLQPPEESDWTSRVDPTKLRNRKFQTGRSAKGPPVANRVDSSWTESPEQKMERIRDEVMGVKTSIPVKDGSNHTEASRISDSTHQRIQKYNASTEYDFGFPLILLTSLRKQQGKTWHSNPHLDWVTMRKTQTCAPLTGRKIWLLHRVSLMLSVENC